MNTTKTIPTEKPSRRPIFKISLLLVGLALVVSLSWILLNTLLTAVEAKEVTIEIETGQVQKKLEDQWVTLTSGQTIEDGDTLQSGSGTDATITFSNGSNLRLDENTQVTIKASSSNISIRQTLGRTWSRVTKLLGQNESYEVETPTAVATVRGTTFSTTIDDEDTLVEGDSEKVEVSAYERVGRQRRILESLIVSSDESIRVRRPELADLKTGRGKLTKERLREEIKKSPWFLRNRQRDQIKPAVRRQFLERVSNLLNNTKAVPGDLMKLRNLMEKAQSGQLNLTKDQQNRLRPFLEKFKMTDKLDPERIPEAAQILAIVDPENFSDTSYWEKRLRLLLPLISQFRLKQVSLNQ